MESIRWELINTKARDLTLEAARDAGPRKSSRPLPTAQIKKLLDSRNERDVLDGLRRVVAVCCGEDIMMNVTEHNELISDIDAICQSSTAHFDVLRCCFEDSVDSISLDSTTRL